MQVAYRLNGTVVHTVVIADQVLAVRRVVRRVETDHQRALAPVMHILAADLRVGDRLGFAIDTEKPGTAAAFVSQFGDPQLITKGGKSTGRYSKPKHVAIVSKIVDLRPMALRVELWFLLGAYIGDGYRTVTRGEVSFCVGPGNGKLCAQVTTCLAALGIGWNIDSSGGPSNLKIRVRSAHLSALCGAFGDGASSKQLPTAIFHLELTLADALYRGYFATDGSAQGRRKQKRGNELQARWKIASVSLQLLTDFQRLMLRFGQFASINVTWHGGPQVIMGRTVQTKPRWELTCRLDPVKRTVYEFDGLMVWIRIREVGHDRR